MTGYKNSALNRDETMLLLLTKSPSVTSQQQQIPRVETGNAQAEVVIRPPGSVPLATAEDFRLGSTPNTN